MKKPKFWENICGCPIYSRAGMLASAMPVGVSAYVFANRYDTGHGTVAAGSLLSAICSVVSLSLVLVLIG
jgi:hypothetical protein